MNPASIISEIGSLLSRNDIDSKITNWLQNTIDEVFMAIKANDMITHYDITMINGTREYTLRGNISEVSYVGYVGSGTGYEINRLSPSQIAEFVLGRTNKAKPTAYYVQGKIIGFDPIPDSGYTYRVSYYSCAPNIQIHTMAFVDDNNAATTGIALYLDEDGVSSGEGKLYFVSPTAENAKLRVSTIDGHSHLVTVYHSTTAATLGKLVYVDEDAANTDERLLFVSPLTTDCVVAADISLNHTHYIKIMHNPNAASIGVRAYVDEDAYPTTNKLLFVSPTNTSSTDSLVVSSDGSLPGLLEEFRPVLIRGTMVQALYYGRQYDESGKEMRHYSNILGQASMSVKSRNKTYPSATRLGNIGSGTPWYDPLVRRN